jgi:hypothetical protein
MQRSKAAGPKERSSSPGSDWRSIAYMTHRYARRTIDKKSLQLLQAYDWPGNQCQGTEASPLSTTGSWDLSSMIGIRSTLPACNCIYSLYDCGIHRRINTEMPSSGYDVATDEVNLGCTSPFEVLQHGCLQIAVSIQDLTEQQIMRFARNASSVASRRDWIDPFFSGRTPLASAIESASSYVL